MGEHPHDHDHDHDDRHGHPGDHAHRPGPVADASVRRARPNDAPAVGVLQSIVFRDAYAGRIPDEVLAAFEPEPFARAWRTSLAAPPEGVHDLLVACAGEQVVGAVAIGPSQDPDADAAWGEVGLLAVHPQARRQGHGSRLLNAGVDLLREAGAESAVVWLPADDEGARTFLTGSGFGPDGAFRDRVVSPDGDALREVRLVARIADDAG